MTGDKHILGSAGPLCGAEPIPSGEDQSMDEGPTSKICTVCMAVLAGSMMGAPIEVRPN